MPDPARLMIFGTWDLLHVGHVRAIQQAHRRCNTVIVGVESDRLVELYKPHPAVIPELERLEMIKALGIVANAYIYDHTNYWSFMQSYAANCLAWNMDNIGVRHLAFLDRVRAAGYRIYPITYTDGISTSAIRQKIREQELC